ncbi:MAG: hypothetical protein K8F58_02685, partial [Bauldia sp.]|nr:hypothetical protein [Bauldia sp.]
MAVLLTLLVFAGVRAGAAEALSPEDVATIRLDIIDLLANAPDLPLPVRQRREALAAYYDASGGDLLWLGSRLAADFV